MENSLWKDATIYSRGDAERKQTAWELSNEHLRIWVSNDHRWYPNKWVYSCYQVGVNDAKELNLPNTATPEQAQERALMWVRARLQKMLDSISQTGLQQ